MIVRCAYSICLLLGAVGLLAGCGHVEELRSARMMQAAEYNQRAQQAFRQGEYQRAASLYEQALALDVSIEHLEGIAVNTLNLARSNQVQGKNAQAERLLDQLLGDKVLHYAPAHLAQAAVQKSLLRLTADDAPGALIWAEKAAAWCERDCRLSGIIASVRANIALRTNDVGQALYWSDRAAAENKNIPLEYANALRLQASALLMKKSPEEALRHAGEALLIDKSLGLPEKIREDLLLAAQAHEQLGHAGQAAAFRARAARIAGPATK